MQTSQSKSAATLRPTPNHHNSDTGCAQYEFCRAGERVACLTGPPRTYDTRWWLVSAARIAGVPYTFCGSFSAAIALARVLGVTRSREINGGVRP